MKDPNESIDVRVTAGLALILQGKDIYHEIFIEYASECDHADRKRWYELLSDPRHKEKSGIDPRVVLMGFDLVQAEKELTPDYIHGSYSIAITLGEYVGQEFTPDQSLPLYNGKHGLKDKYYEDKVKNAIHWWKENGEKTE